MKKETLVNRYLDHLDLEQMHQEGISSTARKAGKQTGKKLRPFRFFAGKAAVGVGKTVIGAGKAVIGAGKVAGKTAAGAGKMAKTGGSKIGGVWRGIKSVNKAIKAPGKKLFNNTGK